MSNHLFTTYHTYHKAQLGIKELTYDPYIFFSSSPAFGIVGIQINNILILADNDFASIEEDVIKSTKIMTKNREYLTYAHPLKFSGAQIKLDLDRIVLIKESHIGGILLVTDNIADLTSFKGITRKKLSPKEQYLGQRAKSAYITSVYQPEAFFNFSQAAQIIEFLSDDIVLLNKRLQ